MSDFFSLILQRHQGESPTVEPRRRARFEPDPLAGSVLPTFFSPDETPSDERPWARPEPDQPQPVAPAQGRVAPSVAAPAVQLIPQERLPAERTLAHGAAAVDPSPIRKTEPPGGRVSAALQPLSRHEAAAESPVAPRGTDSDTSLLVAPPLPRPIHPLVAAPSKAPSEAMPAGMQRRAEGPPGEMIGQEDYTPRGGPSKPTHPTLPVDPLPAPCPARVPEVDSDLPSKARHLEVPEPAPVPAADEHQREALLIPPAWLARLQAEIQRQGDLRRPQKQPEPVINVTIGRVEVYASAPAAPPKPKSKPKAPGVMSLDDYLNQRKGRGGP